MTVRHLLLALPVLAAFPAAAEPPRLRGILVGGGERVALLATDAGGTVPAREGEVVDGFAVREVARDHVVVDGEGRRTVLELAASAASQPPRDSGGATFGLAVNPPAPAPD